MPFFSVIVPIYNVEPYLRECVDSILGQSFKDMECILVDDGSPDGCPAICDAYSAQDNRVRVIHKKNGGLSDARNAGMRIAEGTYFCFIDSDDFWAEPHCLETMYHELERAEWSADIAVYRFKFYAEESGAWHETKVWYDTEFLNASQPLIAMRETIKKGYLLASACEGCFSAAFLKGNDLYFKKGIRSEDTEWVIRIYGHDPKIWYTNYPYYVYRSRAGSITRTPDLEKSYELAAFLLDYADQMDPSCANDYLRLCFLAYHYLVCIGNTQVLASWQGGKELLRRLHRYQWLLEYDLVPKVHFVHNVKRVLGFRLTAYLLGLYMKRN